mmetsp:Transcript_111589/g.193664  ORF Transcript_111589/g.193664 Transcript_111589/m.193664 type:complete len:688 (-) Transcript_111589:5-2068(-)
MHVAYHAPNVNHANVRSSALGFERKYFPTPRITWGVKSNEWVTRPKVQALKNNLRVPWSIDSEWQVVGPTSEDTTHAYVTSELILPIILAICAVAILLWLRVSMRQQATHGPQPASNWWDTGQNDMEYSFPPDSEDGEIDPYADDADTLPVVAESQRIVQRRVDEGPGHLPLRLGVLEALQSAPHPSGAGALRATDVFAMYLTGILLQFDPVWASWWQGQKWGIPELAIPTYRACMVTRKQYVRTQYRKAMVAVHSTIDGAALTDLWQALRGLRASPGPRAELDQQLAILFALLPQAQQSQCVAVCDDIIKTDGLLPLGRDPLPLRSVVVFLRDGFHPPRLMPDVFPVYDPRRQQYVLLWEEKLTYSSLALDQPQLEDSLDLFGLSLRMVLDGSLFPFSVADARRMDPAPAVRARANTAISALAGATAGLLTASVFLPIDRLKTQQQLYRTSIYAAFEAILRGEGLWGFMRGWKAASLSAAITGAVLFPILEARRHWAASTAGPMEVRRSQWFSLLGAYLVAGAVASALAMPIEVAKVRLVANPQWVTQDWIWVVSRVLQEEGLEGLYHGLPVLTLRNWGYLLTRLMVYDLGAAAFHRWCGRSLAHQASIRTLQLVLGGCLAACMAHTPDTFLTHMVYGSPSSTGTFGVWNGALPHCLWAAVTIALLWPLYAVCKRVLYRGMLLERT